MNPVSLKPMRVRALIAAAFVAFLTLVTFGQGEAEAYVSPAEARQSAELGANWFEQTQADDGALAGTFGGGNRFGEWALTALAAGDRSAADAVPALSGPSAQAYYDGFWTNRGPGSASCPPGGSTAEVCELQPDGLPTDAERTTLSAIAGGLQPSRISASRDYVSRIAFWWDGKQIGYRDLLNDDIFGIIALKHAGAPAELLKTLAVKVRAEQLNDGGWHWRAGISPAVTSDTDMTASAIGALCSAGADPATDTAIQKGLGLLEQRQLGTSGGFSTTGNVSGINTNSTAWVVSGLNACGIDAQQSPWVTSENNTPLDFLVDMQNDNGSFRYMPQNPAGSANLMASYQAVSPLGGNDWSGEAPAREVPGQPAVKSAPVITTGTTVPLTLVIDQGAATTQADRVRMCRVEINQGDGLDAVLSAAETASSPGRCAQGVTTSLVGGGISVTSLNGGNGGWTVSRNYSAASSTSADAFGLGDMVVLRYQGTDALSPTAVVPVPQIEGKTKADPSDPSDPDPVKPIEQFYAKAKIKGKPFYRKGRIHTRITCPAGSGATGCNVTLGFAVKKQGKAGFRKFASTAVQVPSGESRKVRIKAGQKVRSAFRKTAKRKLGKGIARIQVTAGTRSPDGVVSFSSARVTVRGR